MIFPDLSHRLGFLRRFSATENTEADSGDLARAAILLRKRQYFCGICVMPTLIQTYL
jgi:hypothetical protein